jgi:hypothetical protein
VLRVFLGRDCSECVSQPLVLYDGRTVDTLILAEDPVGNPPQVTYQLTENSMRRAFFICLVIIFVV